MHVNFGIMEPLDPPIRNKGARYHAYAERGATALEAYARALEEAGLLAPGGGAPPTRSAAAGAGAC